jgi:CTP:molybdopterin cytidylyltransferase MocA
MHHHHRDCDTRSMRGSPTNSHLWRRRFFRSLFDFDGARNLRGLIDRSVGRTCDLRRSANLLIDIDTTAN